METFNVITKYGHTLTFDANGLDELTAAAVAAARCDFSNLIHGGSPDAN